MVRIRHLLRLLPCLLLTACSSPASNDKLPAPSGKAKPAQTASTSAADSAPPNIGIAAPAASSMVNADPVMASSTGFAMHAALPLSVADLPGIACTQKRKDWSPECTAGEYQISVYTQGCSGEGFYGRVYSDDEKGVTLRSAFEPFPAKPVAKLREAQFVCLAADARKAKVDEAVWYYVTAIPAESVKACKGKEICGNPGTPQVEWAGPAPQGKCRLEQGQYVDCAAGWVSASQLEEFSNGL